MELGGFDPGERGDGGNSANGVEQALVLLGELLGASVGDLTDGEVVDALVGVV